MYAAILAAQDHVNLETYILDDDEVGQRFAQALIAKQQQGVQVNLIRDSVGTLGTPAAFFQQLTDHGVEVLEFNPINPTATRKDWELNQRDHRKLLIVDGRTAFLGGINISSVYSGGSFRQGSRSKPRSGPEASPHGATPTCNCRDGSGRVSRSCSWRPGKARRASRWRRRTTSRPPRTPDARWCARSAVRPTNRSA